MMSTPSCRALLACLGLVPPISSSHRSLGWVRYCLKLFMNSWVCSARSLEGSRMMAVGLRWSDSAEAKSSPAQHEFSQVWQWLGGGQSELLTYPPERHTCIDVQGLLHEGFCFDCSGGCQRQHGSHSLFTCFAFYTFTCYTCHLFTTAVKCTPLSLFSNAGTNQLLGTLVVLSPAKRWSQH